MTDRGSGVVGRGGTGRALRGMTLVEVVVALAVLSLVVLALGASLRGMSASAQRIDDRAEHFDEFRVGVSFLRELMERAVPVRLPAGDSAGRRLLLEADAQHLAWVAVMPPRFGLGGRFAFRLSPEPQADGSQALVLRYAPFVDDALSGPVWPDWAAAEQRVLLSRLDGLRLAYGGEGLAQGWQPAWPAADARQADRLPPRLRLDVQTAGAAWPPVVLPMRGLTPPAPMFTIGGGAS